MHHQNLEQLKALRLFGMARALEELAHTRERDALTFDDQLAVLIEREAADRANLALTHRLRRASAPERLPGEPRPEDPARARSRPRARSGELPLG